MLNRKLLEVLARLSEQEHRQLRLFIQSPYFYYNIRRSPAEVYRLYEYIMEYISLEDHPALDKAVVSRHFFPDKPFKEKEKGPIDSLSSDLFALTRRFLNRQQPESEFDSLKEDLAMMRFYRKFGMEERFEQVEAGLKKALDQYPLEHAEIHKLKSEFAEEVINFSTINNPSLINAEQINLHHHLDLYYALLKIDHLTGLQAQSSIIHSDTPQEEAQINMADTVLKFISSAQGKTSIPLQLFQMVVQLQQAPENTGLLVQFGDMLQDYENRLSPELHLTLATHYRNFYAWQYSRTGDPILQKKLFEILAEHLQKKLLYYDGYLYVANLRMLTMHALKLNLTDYIKAVLETHPPERLCGTKFPKEAYDLNWAEYYFHLNHYEKAAEHLDYKPFEHPILGILADALLVKIYFETKNELLDARLKALDQKVRRSKLAKETKQRYYNFVRLLDKLERYRWAPNKKKFPALMEEIKNTPDVLHRAWLIEKGEAIHENLPL